MNLHCPKAFLTKQIQKTSNQNDTHRELTLKKLTALAPASGGFLDSKTETQPQNESPQNPVAQLPEAHQAWLAKNEAAWKRLYKEAVHLHNRLNFVSEAERAQNALKILDYFDIIELHWAAERYFWRTGKTQDIIATEKTPDELPPPNNIAEAFKLRNNYRVYVTRNRQAKNTKKLAMYQKALARCDAYIAEYESENQK